MAVKVTRMNILENPQGALRAFCSVNIAERITINDVRVVEGKNGLFVSMPQKKGKEDKYYSIVFIDNEELRGKVNEEIIRHYENQVSGVSQDEDFSDEDLGIE